MKKYLSTSYNVLLLAISLLLLGSCQSDDAEVEPPFYNVPEISLNVESGNYRVEQTIRLNVTLLAQGLLEDFSVSLDGAILQSKSYGNLGQDTFLFELVVPEAWLGTSRTLVFTLGDGQGQTVTKNFVATISEIAPLYDIEDVQINGTPFKQITGTVNFDEFLDNENLWLLNGPVLVDDITTLTIEEGTAIYALDSGTRLDVQIGGLIIAEGSATDPIVLNSLKAAPGQEGNPASGDWEGLVLRGNDTPEGNSGTLKYVRIENAGGGGNEALQLRQVGGQTMIDFLQTYNSGDTGIRMRGGYVNLKHIVSTKPSAIGLRFSDGWQGNGQFWVIVSDVEDDLGINGRDRESSPRTSNTILSNITVVGPNIVGSGPGSGEGVQIRDGAVGQFYNTAVSGFNVSFRNRTGTMTIKNSAAFNNGSAGDAGSLHSSVRDDFRLAENNNTETAFDFTAIYVGSSSANSSNASLLGGFFDAVDFVGAVPLENDWTAGWTRNLDGTLRE